MIFIIISKHAAYEAGMCSENIMFTYKSFNERAEDILLLQTRTFNTQTYGKRIFEYNGSRLWNALPHEMRVEEDIGKFKRELKTFVVKWK